MHQAVDLPTYETVIDFNNRNDEIDSTGLPSYDLAIDMSSPINHVQQQEPEIRRTVSTTAISDVFLVYERNQNGFVIFGILFTLVVGAILRFMAVILGYGVESFEILNWLFLTYQLYCLVISREGKEVSTDRFACLFVFQVLILFAKLFNLVDHPAVNEK